MVKSMLQSSTKSAGRSTSVWNKIVKLALSAFVAATVATSGVNAFGECPSGAAAIRSVPFDLGGQILPPGCYGPEGAASFALTGKLILNGVGDYSFHSTSITTAANSIVALSHGALCDSVDWKFDAAANFGAASTFIGNVETEDASINVGASSAVSGDFKAGEPGIINWGANVHHKSCAGVEISTAPSILQAAAPLSSIIAGQLGGQHLYPGHYRAVSNSAFSLAGRLILDGAGAYSFSTPGAINTAASSFIELRNGANCKDISWNAGGEINVGASSTFAGSAQSGANSAINLGASSVSRGALHAGNGIVNVGAKALHTSCLLSASSPLLAGVLLCDAGSAPINGACTFCPPGTYALAGKPNCTPCAPGFWAPINSVSIDACYPLVAAPAPPATSSSTSVLCDAGSAPVNGECKFCPVGTYALAGKASCTHCPSGFWAPINSVSPDACYPLAAAAPVSGAAAIHCDAGSAPANGVCKFCPVGSYALAGKQSCTHCPAGYSAPINSVSKDACYKL